MTSLRMRTPDPLTCQYHANNLTSSIIMLLRLLSQYSLNKKYGTVKDETVIDRTFAFYNAHNSRKIEYNHQKNKQWCLRLLASIVLKI